MSREFSNSNFEVSLHPATKLLREVLDQNAKFAQDLGSKLDVNATDFDAMGHLMEHGAMTAGDLAKAVGISPGAATVMIDRLVSVGHVERQTNPKDRRGVIVAPNPKSVDKAWKLLSPLIEASEEALLEMKPAERRAIETYLKAMLGVYSGPT